MSSTRPQEIALIWAQASNGIIGSQGQMPWHLPEDLAHFKALTSGHPVIMGRKTWDSLPPAFRPLPGRRNVVISRQTAWQAEGAEAAPSLEAALALLADAPLVWVMGGGQIYAQALPLAQRLEVTEIDIAPAGDTLAPEIDRSQWQLHTPEAAWQQSRTGLAYRFLTWTRQPQA